jgi:hypothetical protein
MAKIENVKHLRFTKKKSFVGLTPGADPTKFNFSSFSDF